jgi:hypothetical protein
MIDALKLLGLFGIGAALGWWLKGRASARKRVFMATWILLGAPVVLFVVANVLRSDSLAMIAGLSLMVLVAAAVPLGLGFLVGTILAGRSRGRSSESTASEQLAPSQPVTDALVSPSSPVLSAQHRGLFIAVAGVASGFWVMLAVGFRLHDQPIPVEVDKGLLPAAVVLIATVSWGLRALWQRRSSRVIRDPSVAIDEHKARVAEYERDPRATACCEHLAPIESAMRATGLRVQPGGSGAAVASCCIDMEALAQKFSLPESVKYQEWYSPDRSGQDPPHALLYCAACESRLWVLHTGEALPGTPTFPA